MSHAGNGEQHHGRSPALAALLACLRPEAAGGALVASSCGSCFTCSYQMTPSGAVMGYDQITNDSETAQSTVSSAARAKSRSTPAAEEPEAPPPELRRAAHAGNGVQSP